MELDAPTGDMAARLLVSKYCLLSSTTKVNSRPPVITRVCHESRQVAFENAVDRQSNDNGQVCVTSKLSDSTPSFWFSQATDTVHTFAGLKDHPSMDIIPPNIHLLLEEILRGWIPSLIGEHFVTLDPPRPDLPPNKRVDLFRGRKAYLVCLEVVSIHGTADQAINSGLFGRLGEEPIKMVDPFDEETIQRFYNLWRQGPEQDTEPARFFDRAMSPADFQKTVERWRDLFNWFFLAFTWVASLVWGETPTPLDIWRPRTSDEEKEATPLPWKIGPPDPPIVTPPIVGPLPSGARTKMRPQTDHPYVKRVLNSLPEMRPMIMFRFCQERCYLNSKDEQD